MSEADYLQCLKEWWNCGKMNRWSIKRGNMFLNSFYCWASRMQFSVARSSDLSRENRNPNSAVNS